MERKCRLATVNGQQKYYRLFPFVYTWSFASVFCVYIAIKSET